MVPDLLGPSPESHGGQLIQPPVVLLWRMKIEKMAPAPSILSTSPPTVGAVDATNLEATQAP